MKKQTRRLLDQQREGILADVEQRLAPIAGACSDRQQHLNVVTATLNTHADELRDIRARIEAIEELLNATTATLAAGMTQLVAGQDQIAQIAESVHQLVESLRERNDLILAHQRAIGELEQSLTLALDTVQRHSRQLRDLRRDLRSMLAGAGVTGLLVIVAMLVRRALWPR
jgi:chromosome segregation ATPase